MLGLLIGGKGVPLYRWEGGQVAVVSLGAPTLALRGNHWLNAGRYQATPDEETPAHQASPARGRDCGEMMHPARVLLGVRVSRSNCRGRSIYIYYYRTDRPTVGMARGGVGNSNSVN